MAAAKSRSTAAQAAAIGMVGPAAGMKLLEQVVASSTAGVLGGASQVYWRLLLRSVKQPPPIFAAVLAGQPDRPQVSSSSVGSTFHAAVQAWQQACSPWLC